MSGQRRLTDNIKVEILALVLTQGRTITACAEQYGFSRGHLSRTINAFLLEYPVTPQIDFETLIRDLETRCWEAIHAALTDTTKANVFRRAVIGIRFLQLLGRFKDPAQEGRQPNHFANIEDLPRDWYERVMGQIESDATPKRDMTRPRRD